MELAQFKVLSDGDIRDIHEATVDILTNCGVKILYRPMLEFLKKKGLCVDAEQAIVRFSRSSLEDALGSVPPQFEVFDRNGRLAYTLGDRRPKIAAGHNAVFWDAPGRARAESDPPVRRPGGDREQHEADLFLDRQLPDESGLYRVDPGRIPG